MRSELMRSRRCPSAVSSERPSVRPSKRSADGEFHLAYNNSRAITAELPKMVFTNRKAQSSAIPKCRYVQRLRVICDGVMFDTLASCLVHRESLGGREWSQENSAVSKRNLESDEEFED